MGLSFCFICLDRNNYVTLRTKSNYMNTINIPQNGFPQEITNIPFGQVIVLTDPSQGITSTTVQKIQAVISIAGSLGQKGVVYAIPVDSPELWDSYICKVKTKDGVQILVSDKDSIIEMLCEFWGLDYAEAIKKIVIKKRYEGHVTIGEESHPVRIPVIEARKPEKEEKHSILLQCITTHTKAGELAKIEDALEEAFIHHINISGIDLLTLLDKVSNKERKTYQLDIDIIPGKADYDKELKDIVVKRSCDIIITDSDGTSHHITTLSPQSIALYLTFILFKDGIKIADLKTNDEFYKLFLHICNRLRYMNKLPEQKILWENANRKRGEIKKAISDVTNGDKIAEMQLGIEGEEGKEYRVAGATDDLREKIRKGFDIE